MNYTQKYQQERTPYLQLLMLIFYAILGLIIITAVAFLMVYLKYGIVILQNMEWMTGTDPYYLPGVRILLTAQQIGLFLVPGLLLAITEHQSPANFYGFKKPRIEFLFIILLIMVCAMPILDWITELNQKMIFPDFLKSVEKWMKEAEDQGMETTKVLLKMDSVEIFLVNIGMIALLPAIAEELMFRGGLQRTLTRMFKNPHVAIWFSAFIFSAIHMQFYGFLPRLLLGATFGYIYLWSGNLWYAMFGHFINNAYAVCAAWYMQKNNIPLSEADKTMNIAWYGYIISLVLTFILFRYFKNKTISTHEQQLD